MMVAPGRPVARVVAVAALAVAAVVILLVVTGSSEQTIRAQFYNAGRLVEGGQVQLAGRQVGEISAVRLADDGLAEIELAIDDETVLPLHEGTRAAIRAVGAGTLANNFVDLRPGPASGAELPDGAVLPTSQTHGIVDLDAFLSSFDDRARDNLQALIARSSQVFAGSGSRWFNGMLGKLNPALASVDRLMTDLGSEQAQLARFVTSSETAAGAVASRREDLRAAVGNTARTMNALAREREAIATVLDRTPAALDQGRATLAELTGTVTELRPTLRAIPRVAEPARDFLRQMTAVLPRATPVIANTRGQLPGLRAVLASYPPLEPIAREGLESARLAFRDTREITRGLRLYGADMFLGVFNGLVSIGMGNYRKTGHYIRQAFSEPPQAAVAGPAANILKLGGADLIPELFQLRTGLINRCPGANAPPAPDGSSPNHDDTSICDPSQSMSGDVNNP